VTPNEFQENVLHWFDHFGRTDLPWQQKISAYRVWVSEIMLQQTQVSTVIPYYHRFMAAYPKVQDLAKAESDEVMHYWTGLGYYARARNLHKTAKLVSHQLDGKFPSTVDSLSALPGIGRSTAGAICAIAFKRRAAILDGNVKRVLARFSATDGWPGKTEVMQRLWTLTEKYTPEARIADYTQAMMDLGATVCTRSNPKCTECPLNTHCRAYKDDRVHQFPGKKPKKTLPVKEKIMLVIRNVKGEILLQQNPPTGLWGGLWVLPMVDSPSEIGAMCSTFGLSIKHKIPLQPRRHTFSHFHLDYQPIEIDVYNDGHQWKIQESAGQVWYNLANPLLLGLPAPIKALLGDIAINH
jgi:A/G-specific adenine glycosylase